MHLVEKAGHRLRDFDWLYLPRLDSPSTRELVTALGFPRDRIVQHDPRYDLETDELVATTYPGTPGNLPAYTPDFLRERFAPPSVGARRKIFLSREGARRDLANRPEIERLLLARGFEICRPQTDHAVRACAAADVIVSQEGANLMNTLFAPPGTRVLLLLPDTGNNLPYALTLAATAGHRLFIQSCPLVDRTPGHENSSPVRPDLTVFASGLDQLLAAR
ncbi:MAG: glycosyltransferase family 61 protein [Verrucomicrobia bacterium]|nr:glycosyltransferase family 61 protein [Verrucomicrobiota bacterium]